MSVAPRTFVRLKLRLTANGLRGRTGRVALFVLSVLGAVYFAATGYLVFAIPGFLDDERVAGMLLPLGGAALVLGWVFFPLIFFGVDESLDPARFALLPLGRRTLITGLFAASLVGLPAVSTLLVTLGMVHTAAVLGGPAAAVVQLAGVVLGLLLCTALCRSVTSAFATALRSRRARDLATVAFAVLLALIGPLQLLAQAGAERADWDGVAAAARVVAWTPLGAPYSIGLDVAAGRAWAVPVKLVVVLASIVLLLRWWAATVETAMVGTAGGGRPGGVRGGTPVSQLLVRGLPRSRFGALTAREVRYWWRETRRRTNLITFAVVGVFLPVMLAVTGGPGGAGVMLVLVGALAVVGLANQFAFDGNAYGANVVAGVPARLELHSRVAALTVFTLPLMIVIAVVVGVAAGVPGDAPALLGTLLAAYGVGLALVLPISVVGAYAFPDTTNPFAASSGSGGAKGLLHFAALFVTVVVTAPVQVGAYVLDGVWPWIGLPVGLAYGVGAYLIGVRIAGGLLERRMPELLAAVTPNR